MLGLAQQLVAFAFDLLAPVDLVEVDADAGHGGVDPQLVPRAVRREVALEVAGDALLHRQPPVLVELGVAHLREQLIHHAADQAFRRHAQERGRCRIGVHDAPLPVEGDEAVGEVLEHGEQPLLAVDDGRDGGRAGLLDEDGPAVRRGGHLHLAAHHDGRASAAGELEFVHHLGDHIQSASAEGRDVGLSSRVEGVDVEPGAVVGDAHAQAVALEGHLDLQVLRGTAVLDGVGAGLLDAEDHVVDIVERSAVHAQVVAHALAHAKQPRRVQGHAEGEPRECDRSRFVRRLRQSTSGPACQAGGFLPGGCARQTSAALQVRGPAAPCPSACLYCRRSTPPSPASRGLTTGPTTCRYPRTEVGCASAPGAAVRGRRSPTAQGTTRSGTRARSRRLADGSRATMPD